MSLIESKDGYGTDRAGLGNPLLPLVSVVVPAYNECSIVAENLKRLYDHLSTLKGEFDCELIVVDDGSTDGTKQIVDEFARGHQSGKVVHHIHNLRLGQALRTGFAHCRGDYVVTMDVDLSYCPEHIERMLRTLRDTGADIVIASPYMKGGRVSNVPWFRKKLSAWANRFLAFACRENLRTITGMVRAYNRLFLAGLDLKARGVDIHSEIIHKGAILQARMVEIPGYLDWGALGGTERRSSMRVMSGIAWNLLSGFMFRPFVFYIILGLVFFLLSLIPLGWALAHTIHYYSFVPAEMTGFGSRFSVAVAEAFKLSPHSFVVGGFALMVAIQMMGLGAMALQSHRYFKDLYHMTSSIYRRSETGRDAWGGTFIEREDADGQS